MRIQRTSREEGGVESGSEGECDYTGDRPVQQGWQRKAVSKTRKIY